MNAGFLVSRSSISLRLGAQIIGGELADRLPIKWVYLGAQWIVVALPTVL